MDYSTNKIVKKSIREENADKPSSTIPIRRILPSTEQSLQSITENLISIYGKLSKLEKQQVTSNSSNECNSRTCSSSKSSLEFSNLEERLNLIESKIDRVVDTNLKLYNIEENNQNILLVLQSFEKRFYHMENIISAVVKNNVNINSAIEDLFVKNQTISDGLDELRRENFSNSEELINKFERHTSHTQFYINNSSLNLIKSVKNENVKNFNFNQEELKYLNNNLSNQNLNIEFIKNKLYELGKNENFQPEEFKISSEKMFSDNFDSIKEGLLETCFDNFESIKEELNYQFKNLNDNSVNIITSKFNNFKETTIEESSSQFEYMENKMVAIRKGNSTIFDKVECLRREIQANTDFQVESNKKVQEIYRINIDEIRKSSEEMIKMQTDVKNLSQIVEYFNDYISSCLKDNSSLISVNTNYIDKINKNIIELKTEMSEGNVIQEIMKFEESLNCVENDSEDIYKKIDNILTFQTNIQNAQKDTETAIEKRLNSFVKMQKENNYGIENILENQQVIQERQITNTDKLMLTSTKILEDVQKLENISNQITVVFDETFSIKESTKELSKKLDTNNKEYITALQCEMSLCRNNIIKGVTKSIFCPNLENGCYNTSSRNEGTRYVGKGKR
jgi:hypothetical protein